MTSTPNFGGVWHPHSSGENVCQLSFHNGFNVLVRLPLDLTGTYGSKNVAEIFEPVDIHI